MCSENISRIIHNNLVGLRAKLIKSNEILVGMEEFWLDNTIAFKSYSAWNR
jgi:hypothetical protein